MKREKSIIYYLAVCVAVILIFVVGGIFLRREAKKLGNGIGSTAGAAAGVALGSWDGITRGLGEGYDAGKKQGLSAKDTKAVIANEMNSIGKLEILAAEDQLVDYFSEGNDYKAFFVYKTQAVFSVNLAQADISIDENGLKITIPKPECEITIDEEETQKIAEWQRHFWSGSAEAGYKGYMNSMEQIREKAASEMSNYDFLMKQAEASAKKRLEMLVKSITLSNADTGEKYDVNIVFKGGAGDE